MINIFVDELHLYMQAATTQDSDFETREENDDLTPLEKVGITLSKLRHKRKYTYEQLEFLTGIDSKTLVDIEFGLISLDKEVYLIPVLAEALGVSESLLVEPLYNEIKEVLRD